MLKTVLRTLSTLLKSTRVLPSVQQVPTEIDKHHCRKALQHQNIKYRHFIHKFLNPSEVTDLVKKKKKNLVPELPT